ncbi:MAG: MFS transporter [Dehalococcoidia bacterium]
MDTAVDRPATGYAGVFRRNPDFLRLFIAQIISFCGDWFLTVALLGLVLDLTDSGTLAALLIVCQTLPSFLLAPYAGTVVDRVDRRRLMIGVNVISAGMALLPLIARSTETLPFAYLGVIGISSGVAFFSPAAQATLPNVVRDDDLARANVLMGSTWGTMLAVGAALGGFVAASLGRDTAIVVDSISFLVAAVLLWTIRRPFQQTRTRAEVPLLPALREAAQHARHRPAVMAMLTSKGGYGISAGVVALLSVFAFDVFDTGDAGTGVLYGARGVGALLGPFLIRRLGGSDARTFSLIGIGAIVHGLGYQLFAISPAFGLAALFVLIAHLGGGAIWTMSTYGLQRLVPDELRGRIFAADYGLVMLTTSISSVIAGVLADGIGPRATVLLMGTLALAWGAFWTLWTRRLWTSSSEPVTDPRSVGETAD